MFSSRQRLGFQYKPQRDNKIRDKVKTNFNEYNSVAEDFYVKNEQQIDMGGEGIIDLAKKGYEKAKQFIGKASELYGSELGTNVINALPSNDETARPKFAGEKHAMLQLPNGSYGIANYMGPGTQVVKRVARNDPPRTLADKVAQRHDIDFQLATAMSSKDKQLKAVREADNRMINSLNRLEQGNLDAKKNIMLGKQIIKAKTIAEDLGILDKSKFAGDLAKMSDDDKMKLMAKRASLSQEGYGLPGQKLKQKLIKHYNKKGGSVSLPGKGGAISLPGRGGAVSLPGQHGGFIFAFLAGLIALITEATATVTVASVGSALATGAASAVGGIAATKLIGGGVSKQDVAKKVAQKVKATHQKVIDVAKKVSVKVDELPKPIVEKAKEMLSGFSNPSEIPKDKLISISKQLIPSVKKVVQTKIKSKMSGSGMTLPPGQSGGSADMNAKILAKVKKEL
jgi:hypothetical protein